MEIKVTTKEIRKTSLLSKFTLILFGVFLTSLIFAFTVKLFEDIGIWLGLLICLGLIFCGFYYTEPKTRLRLITWSMLITIIAGAIFLTVGINLITKGLGEIF